MLTGAIFWCSFWAVSVAAITWVYSPGGLADPNRDLKEPGSRPPRAVCAAPCEEAEPEPTESAEPVAANKPTIASRSRRPNVGATPTLPVTQPTLPVDVPLPTIRIDVIDAWQTAGNRYATYKITLQSSVALNNVHVSTHIPSGTYFAECSTQAGERVCIDYTTGSDWDHGQAWSFDEVISGRTYSDSFSIHLDSEIPEGQQILNHAHATWGNKMVTSPVHAYSAPAATLI